MSGSLTDGGVDASIPLQAGKNVTQIPNPLQQIGQFAQIQGAINSLKMFPGQFQQQQQQTQTNQSNLIQQQRQLGAASLVPLLAKKGPLSIDDVTTALAGAENSGVVTQPTLADFTSVPMTGNPAIDDAAIRAHIIANSQPPISAVSAIAPRNGTMDVGPAIQPVNIAAPGMPNQGQVTPVGGSFVKGIGPQYVNTGGGNTPTNNGQPVGATIPNTPSPGDMNQLQQVWNPTTKQFDYIPRTNVAPMVNGAGQPMTGGTAPVPGLPQTGRMNPPGATPAVSAPPATASASAPLGANTEAEASALHLGQARERANNYQATIYPIQGAITALQGADTGAGAQTLNTIRSYLGDTPLKYVSSFLPSTLSDQDKRAAYDEAQKYTTAMAIGGPGGARSDAGNQASAAANPNVHISNTAALAVAQSVLAQQRLQQAGTLAFNQKNLPANQYDQFMNTWNTQQDPRAFMADQMNQTQLKQLGASLGGFGAPAYERFRQSYLSGLASGVIPQRASGQQAPAPAQQAASAAQPAPSAPTGD